MTTAGVNGDWSIKDNIAHLAAWHEYLLKMLQATAQGIDFPDPWPDMTNDEINAQIYEENKARSLNGVVADFRSTYQQVMESVQDLSNQVLNKPLSWLKDKPVWPHIAGNTYEHYQEHGQIIRDWLKKTGSEPAQR